jgi:hypothetical protein
MEDYSNNPKRLEQCTGQKALNSIFEKTQQLCGGIPPAIANMLGTGLRI